MEIAVRKPGERFVKRTEAQEQFLVDELFNRWLRGLTSVGTRLFLDCDKDGWIYSRVLLKIRDYNNPPEEKHPDLTEPPCVEKQHPESQPTVQDGAAAANTGGTLEGVREATTG